MLLHDLIGKAFDARRNSRGEVFTLEFRDAGVAIISFPGSASRHEAWTVWQWKPNCIFVTYTGHKPAILRFDDALTSFEEVQEPVSCLFNPPDSLVGQLRRQPQLHEGKTCKITHVSPITGVLFHFVGTPFDICESAFLALPPYEQALFARVERPGDPISGVASPDRDGVMRHHGIRCYLTQQCPLEGDRYHRWGSDYDLCAAAFSSLPADQKLAFVLIPGPIAKAATAAAPNWLAGRSDPAHFPPAFPSSASTLSSNEAPIDLIVDRSGSMASLVEATVAGVNKFLADQRALPSASTTLLSLTVFNDLVERPLCGVPLSSVANVTPEQFAPSGNTALFDAIGSVLNGTVVARRRIVVIVTDGGENASRTYTRERIYALIDERRRAGWTFLFLAANQDAIATGGSFGVPAAFCATAGATAGAFGAAYGALSANVESARFGGTGSFTSAQRAAFHP
jgi:hypothetical protein